MKSLPMGTVITCPTCAKPLAVSNKEIHSQTKLIGSDFIPVHGSGINLNPGAKMSSPCCGTKYGGIFIHTKDGWL
jgi:hypothetical protein